MVFNSGKWNGSNTSTPCGGHVPPVNATRSTSLASPENKLASKNAQNQATKNITSDAINSAIPNRRPICTIGVWLIFARRDIGILSANRIDIGPGKGMRKMFLFGIAYAVSSLSCALPIFLAAIGVVVGQTLNSDSFLEILIGSLAYALGMGIVLITLTLITVSFKKLTFAQKSARTLTPYVNISGKLMMVFGGGYIIYYWTFGIGGALLSYRLEQLIN